MQTKKIFKKNTSIGILKSIFVIAIFAFAVAFFSGQASAASTSTTYTPMEKIPGFENAMGTDFYTYLKALYGFMVWGVGVSAMLMIVIGGFMYITAAGNSSSITKAKGVITDALFGLVLALVSYLCLYIINPDLVNIKKITNAAGGIGSSSSATTSGSSAGTTTPGSSTGAGSAASTGDEAAKRSELSQDGIGVNKNACTGNQTTGCTNTAGLKQETIDGVSNLKKECPDCPITLTGGSENGHASNTEYSHGNGYKADLSLNPTLNSYITNNYSAAGTRSDGAALYKDPGGNVYAKEGDHWDVCYNCNKS